MIPVTAVVGSGIMATLLTDDVGGQLLMNMLAIVLVGLLIWALGPICGAHFTPGGHRRSPAHAARSTPEEGRPTSPRRSSARSPAPVTAARSGARAALDRCGDRRGAD